MGFPVWCHCKLYLVFPENPHSTESEIGYTLTSGIGCDQSYIWVWNRVRVFSTLPPNNVMSSPAGENFCTDNLSCWNSMWLPNMFVYLPHTAMAASLSTLLCFSLETSTLWKPPTRWERQLREDLLAMMPIRYGQRGARLSRWTHQQPLGRLPCQVSGGEKAWLNCLYNASAKRGKFVLETLW